MCSQLGFIVMMSILSMGHVVTVWVRTANQIKQACPPLGPHVTSVEAEHGIEPNITQLIHPITPLSHAHLLLRPIIAGWTMLHLARSRRRGFPGLRSKGQEGGEGWIHRVTTCYDTLALTQTSPD